MGTLRPDGGDRGADGPKRPWTAAETAEDLLAQVEDALVAGWTDAEIREALEREGLTATTAAALLEDVRREAEAGGGPRSSGYHDALLFSLSRTRQALRRDDDALRVDVRRLETLERWLVKSGLRPGTAAAVIKDAVALERRVAAVYRRRMRRLGVQGMAVGGATTALFVFGGLFGGGGARWHLVSAALTAALFAYSVVLHRRGRDPED